MARVFIGIGSNIGDRRRNIESAINSIRREGIKITKISGFYETEPWGVKNQPYFINGVIEVETELSPIKLLLLLKRIERDIGRKKAMKWGPREIDLDILLYDDIILKSEILNIPHPFLEDREFVLKPLCEIAPNLIHPVLKKPVREILNETGREP